MSLVERGNRNPYAIWNKIGKAFSLSVLQHPPSIQRLGNLSASPLFPWFLSFCPLKLRVYPSVHRRFQLGALFVLWIFRGYETSSIWGEKGLLERSEEFALS